MASPQASQKIASRIKVLQFDFNPDVDTAVDVSWQDMQNYRNLMVVFFRKVGTGNLDGFKIIANAESDGSGTDVEIKVHALTAQPNALGDTIFLECQAEELIQEANDAGVEQIRYVSAQIEMATATDEGVVTYIFTNPRFAYDHLTSDLVA